MTWQRVFENPRSPRAQLEALVWKHTHRDYRGVANGIKYVLVNTGAKVFGGGGGTEAWALSKLTDEQLCYQLPRSVREQHPELCGRAANPAEIAKVELYNIIRHGRAVGNGYWVTRYVGGHMPEHRRERLRDFGPDRDAAYAYAEQWNRGAAR